MGDFFNMDNKFFHGVGKAVDCIALSVLWLICCIPVFTAGAATTALYYTVVKVIRHERGYLWAEYWHAFRTNFKQSFFAWLAVFGASAFLAMDCYIMYQYAMAGEKIGSIYIVFVVLIAFVWMWGTYLFPYIARFENKTKQIFKNAFFISVENLGMTVLMLCILLICIFLVCLVPPSMVFMPTVYMLLVSLIMEKIFRKYMSEEDTVAEDERNQEFYN